jgi:phosphate transport system substrate-binding protein
LYIVTAGTKNPYVGEMIDWLLSPQGQELIEKAGYVGMRKEVP